LYFKILKLARCIAIQKDNQRLQSFEIIFMFFLFKLLQVHCVSYNNYELAINLNIYQLNSPKNDHVAKPTSTNFYQYTPFKHIKSLMSILNTFVINTLKTHNLFMKCPKNTCKGNFTIFFPLLIRLIEN